MISLREDIFAFICQLERSRELNYIKKWVVIIIAFFVGFQSFAQQSSVTVTTQFFPPYSLKLSDYATSTDEKLAVQLLLNDITEVNRSVRLRMYIEGKNVAIKTVDFPTGETPLFLDGGFPLRLSNLDIGYLFQLQNLQGINAATYNESLPEGLYQFCFEVYDALTNVRLSQKSCTPVYLVQNDPPILNLPNRGEIVAQKDVQNIIFQWTPRHLNATNVEYEFILKELWDNYADPQAAFLASAPLYQTTSFAPTLLYGFGEPQLLPNKRYAWQVRAISRTGISENSVFKNNGYSEIFHFIYTADCNVPQYLLSEAQSLTKVKVMWQADADQTKFNVQYRKKNVKDAVWFDRPVQNAQETNLYSLQSDTTYEFRVGSNCITDFTGTDPLYSYSDIAEFKTPQKGENSTYNCGYVPSISIANTELIDNLGVNEVFTAGDFPVTVKEVNSENSGSFTGWGFIVVPYLADTRIKVSFKNIKINTDQQLIEGVVLTAYNPTWSNVDNIANEVEAISDIIAAINDLFNELRDRIKELLDKGELTQTEADGLEAALNTEELRLQEGQQMITTGEQLISEGRKEEGDNKKEEGENIVRAVNEALNNYADRLGVNNNTNTTIAQDGYFDGVLTLNKNDQDQNLIIDGNNVIDFQDFNQQVYAQDNYIIEDQISSNKKLIITNSEATAKTIDSVKTLAASIENGEYLLWMHYDLEESKLKYKISFGQELATNFDVTRDDYVNLFNSILQTSANEFIGTALIKTSEGLDSLIEEYNTVLKALLDTDSLGNLTTYEVIEIVLNFTNKCLDEYKDQKEGIVPSCLWDTENVAFIQMAYFAGFVDGAWEIIDLGIGVIKLGAAFNPIDPFYATPEAFDLRKQTWDTLILLKRLFEEEELRSKVWNNIKDEVSKYVDETIALDAQARYNQGKIIFDIASAFFGVAEVKLFLKTGKLTSNMLMGLSKVSGNLSKLFKAVPGKLKKLQNNTLAYILSVDRYIEIARYTDDGIILANKWINEPVEIVEDLGELSYKKGDDLAENITDVAIVKDSDGIVGMGKKIIYPVVKINGVPVVRLISGSNGKIAIVGRKMEYVRQVGADLVKLGKEVELFEKTTAFAGKGYNDLAKIEADWLTALRLYGKNGEIPYEKLKITLWYKENQRWAKWIKEQGYDIYDLGDNPGLFVNAPDRSAFYDIEKVEIFGDIIK